MTKNEIIKVQVKRQAITRESDYRTLNEVPSKELTLDVVIDSVGKSIIKGHYLNESDRRIFTACEYLDKDNALRVDEEIVVRVEIDRETGAVYEYKVFADEEVDYYECEKLRAEAKKLHLQKGSKAWWKFMGRSFLTEAHCSVYAWTTEKKADGVVVA